MYAGAGPQDLPDEGASGGGAAPAVQAGKRLSKTCRKQNGALLQKQIVAALKARYSENPKLLGAFPTPAAALFKPQTLQSPANPSAITIVTQCSIDRLPRLAAMCRSWSGAVSCAVHVPRGACISSIAQTVAAVHATLGNLSVCLRQETEDCVEWAQDLYPINALRNAALDNAKTATVLCLDVDFELSRGAHEKLKRSFSPGSGKPIKARCDWRSARSCARRTPGAPKRLLFTLV